MKIREPSFNATMGCGEEKGRMALTGEGKMITRGTAEITIIIFIKK